MAETTNDEEALRIESEIKREAGTPAGAQVQDDQPQASPDYTATDDHEDTDVGRAWPAAKSLNVPAEIPDKPYSSFSSKEKWVIIVLISLASVFS